MVYCMLKLSCSTSPKVGVAKASMNPNAITEGVWALEDGLARLKAYGFDPAQLTQAREVLALAQADRTLSRAQLAARLRISYPSVCLIIRKSGFPMVHGNQRRPHATPNWVSRLTRDN